MSRRLVDPPPESGPAVGYVPPSYREEHSAYQEADDTQPLPPVETAASAPVFVDASGRRQRRVRRLGKLLVLPAAGYLVLLVSTAIGGPTVHSPFLPLPEPPHQHANKQAPQGGSAPDGALGAAPGTATAHTPAATASSGATPTATAAPSPSATASPSSSPSASPTPRGKSSHTAKALPSTPGRGHRA